MGLSAIAYRVEKSGHILSYYTDRCVGVENRDAKTTTFCMTQHLLLATAGHIDHGKTALVRALTGVDTDRLPDEKRRQITIDLGFAQLDLGDFSIGVVDVPGHERFVKNMLAGAAGVDLAMLVVAADDSVKPQTREHLDVLEHLRLQAGLVVITKCDLVDTDWIEMIEAEVQELTEGTFLADAPVIRVSAPAGEGIDELRRAIAVVAAQVAAQDDDYQPTFFRMAIDRAFTIAGHGTVVTGSVASGQVAVGDKLELQPQGTTSRGTLVRVRGLQTHEADVQTIGRGQRAAINLAGVHYDDVTRGQSLVSCQTLHASQLLTVQLRISDQLSRSLKHRSAIRLHLGTASVPGKVSILGKSEVDPGDTAYAQLFLSKPVAAVWGQPFVIRSVSPVETLGGGQILDPSATKIKRLSETDRKLLDDLSLGGTLRRATAAAHLSGSRVWDPADWPVTAGVGDHEDALKQLVAEKFLLPFPLGNGEIRYLHSDVADRLTARIIDVLATEHRKTPLRMLVERSRLAKHFRQISEELLGAIFVSMQNAGQLTAPKGDLALPDWSPQLSDEQGELLKQIIETYRIANFQPPSVDQITADLGQSREAIVEMIDVAVDSRGLARLTKDLLIDCNAEQQARLIVAANMAGGNDLSVSQIRELLDTSRKIAIPLCEHWDAVGITERHGDLRRMTLPPEGQP